MALGFVGKSVCELDVAAVAFHVSESIISCSVIQPDGQASRHVIGPVEDFLPSIDAVVDGLARTTDVARGRVAALRRFVSGPAMNLLPGSVRQAPPDVLVIIPHGILHGVPLHLLHVECGVPLCSVAGVTYSSSLSEFVQCAKRNPARQRVGAEALEVRDQPAVPRRVAAYCGDVLGREEARFQEIKSAVEAAVEHRLVQVGDRGEMKLLVRAWGRKPPAEPLDAVVVVAHGYVDPVSHDLSGVLVVRKATGHIERGGRMWEPIAMDGLGVFYLPDLPASLPPSGWDVPPGTETLTIADLRTSTLSGVPLVALFGCSAGWSRLVRGDVPSSFGQAFLTVGSSTVVAPSWDAEVGTSAQWARYFFTAWSKFRWPAALSATYATDLLHRSGVPVEHYGAFTLRGDWL
ncbi:CHAT domain-containing protein [Nocardia vinacea]|uniref:CHAT domain-containing protein n=1 Tax=Nocardia vinacea TaxID=96468 RepID=UPI0034104FAB